MITLQKIKNIAQDIKADNEWVNDSHSAYEHKGVCDGLDRLVRHLTEVEITNEIIELKTKKTQTQEIKLRIQKLQQQLNK